LVFQIHDPFLVCLYIIVLDKDLSEDLFHIPVVGASIPIKRTQFRTESAAWN
jgi:hypothetical protein